MAARKRSPNTQTPPAPIPSPVADSGDWSSAEARRHMGCVAEGGFWETPGGVIERSPRTGWATSPFGVSGFTNDFAEDSIPERNRRIDACEYYYKHSPPVKAAVDMFVDFVCSEIEIHHVDESNQERYRHWWDAVDGRGVSERIVSGFFRHSFSAVRTSYTTLKDDVFEAEPASPIMKKPLRRAATIPIRYKVLQPKSIERLGGRAAIFLGDERYGVRMSEALSGDMFSDPTSKSFYERLPADMRNKLNEANSLIEMSADELDVIHYRKDDWRSFGDPIAMAVLKDLVLYDAMKAADKAALEGSISKIRLWILGDADNKLKAPPEDFAKLGETLLAMRNGASMDLIWNNLLKFQETSSDAAAFLGSDKYVSVLQAIFGGFGIPQSLTGGSEAGGMTNNAMSLKTLVERLQSARQLLIKFWTRQFRRLQKAYGDRRPAQLRFADLSVSDEASMLKMYLDMYDRGVISSETLLRAMGELPAVEKIRVVAENAERGNGEMSPRQGPFTDNATHPDQLLKTFVTQGLPAPSEVGVEFKPRKKGEKSLLDHQRQQAVQVAKSKPAAAEKPAGGGVAGQGRPKGVKDSGGRKQRTPKVRKVAASLSFVDLVIKAREDLKGVEALVQPAFLEEVGKKTLRQLTSVEAAAFEDRKYAALMGTPVDAAFSTSTPLLQIPPAEAVSVLNDLRARYSERGIQVTQADARELYATAYALIHQTEEDADGETESDG